MALRSAGAPEGPSPSRTESSRRPRASKRACRSTGLAAARDSLAVTWPSPPAVRAVTAVPASSAACWNSPSRTRRSTSASRAWMRSTRTWTGADSPVSRKRNIVGRRTK